MLGPLCTQITFKVMTLEYNHFVKRGYPVSFYNHFQICIYQEFAKAFTVAIVVIILQEVYQRGLAHSTDGPGCSIPR